MLHDPSRALWVVPIRHHSPACAAHLERLIAAVRPATLLVEGPCDFDPLIDLLCDPRTRAPVAVVALRDAAPGGATRRVASYFPVCAHSPELIALQAAKALAIPSRFIDLPSTAREMREMREGEGRPARSLLGTEQAFDVSDYVAALARELGCRDGNEVWDHLFEARIAEGDWRRFFTDVALYCSAVRAATDPAATERDGTLAREAQMRALLAETRAATEGPIVAVVGGFHAEALVETGAAPAAPVRAGAGPGRAYLMRYGMRQLDALRGYGAGLPLPGYYDRLWNARSQGLAGLGTELIRDFAAHLRAGRLEAPALPVIADAAEQAQRLAILRGRSFPLRDDIVDAVRSTFVKGEIAGDDAVPVLAELRAWLTGTQLGEVPPSAGSPPLIEAARAQAKALGFRVEDGERRTRELDIYRKPRHRAASRFAHGMAFIGTPFAERTGGPDFRNDVGLDRLHEIWSVCWSPLVESRLIELSEAADTLDEALAFVLAHKLVALAEQGRGRSAVAAIDLFAAACRAGLGGAAHGILALIEEQVMEDPELGGVAAALTDLLFLRHGRELLELPDAEPLDRLVRTCWRRLLLLLPDLAFAGPEQVGGAVETLAGLRGTLELARSSAAPIDLGLFDEALADLSRRSLHPKLAGAVMAFALLDGRAGVAALEQRLRGEFASGYVDAGGRLAFLAGIIAVARELVWTMPVILDALDALVSGLDEDAFTELLPHLRLALMPLDPREVDRLAAEVAGRLGVRAEALAATVAISEAELHANLRLDRALAELLVRDGLA